MKYFRKIFSKNLFFCIFFGGLSVALLHPLISTQQGFVFGDYGLQFYPWTNLYADYLKHGQLLLWTPLIQSGFYCFAEGQVGMLYLINLLLFCWLDFNIAWNLVFIVHFLMGGIFAYLFAKKIKCSNIAATITAILFTFGSAYAGCFYNVVTLRTLVWFPLMLFFAERLLQNRCRLSGYGLAFVASQCWLAGFSQMAAYANGFAAMYYISRLFESKDKDVVKHLFFFLMLGLGLFIATPQIWATLELASHSTRQLQSSEFALWGSFAPWSLLTMLMYTWSGMFKSGLYIGIISLMMVLSSPIVKMHKACVLMLLLSFFLALGAFNPIYHLAIKLPIMSLLRNPSKFLFFSAFFFSCLAGLAWDHFFAQSSVNKSETIRAIWNRAKWWIVFCFVSIYSVWILTNCFGDALIQYGQWYADKYVIGKSFHRYSSEHYYQKVEHLLQGFRDVANVRDAFFWLPQIFLISFGLLLWRFKQAKISSRMIKSCLIALILVDIYTYGASGYGTGFLGNLDRFDTITQKHNYPKDGKWLDLEKSDQTLSPNLNILQRQAVLGAYTPILDLAYYELFAWTGELDDSVGNLQIGLNDINLHKNLLDFVGIKYILPKRNQTRDSMLYQKALVSDYWINPRPMSEFNWVSQTRVIKDKGERISYLHSSAFDPRIEAIVERAEYGMSQPIQNVRIEVLPVQSPSKTDLRVNAAHKGLLIRNQLFDPGWRVSVNGQKSTLIRVNHAFQGVELNEGFHEVLFYFRPNSFIIGRWFMVIGYILLICGAALIKIPREKK